MSSLPDCLHSAAAHDPRTNFLAANPPGREPPVDQSKTCRKAARPTKCRQTASFRPERSSSVAPWCFSCFRLRSACMPDVVGLNGNELAVSWSPPSSRSSRSHMFTAGRFDRYVTASPGAIAHGISTVLPVVGVRSEWARRCRSVRGFISLASKPFACADDAPRNQPVSCRWIAAESKATRCSEILPSRMVRMSMTSKRTGRPVDGTPMNSEL